MHLLSGLIINSSNNQNIVLDIIEQNNIKLAIDSRQSVSSILFKCDLNGESKIYITFINTIRDAENNIIGSLVCRIDPFKFLYPLVENWPLPSRTAESFIFQTESDSILYLNNLRHLKNTALNLKIPISETALPAAIAVSGYSGIIQGKDYRGIDVTAYATKIDGTQWNIISKIDNSEIYEEVPFIIGSILGFVLLGIFITSFSIGFVYNHRQKVIYKELYSKEKEIWQYQEKFKVTIDSLGEGIIITDINAKIQYMNTLAEDLTGWNFREAKGRYLGEIYSVRNELTGQKENNILEKVVKHGIIKELANHTILISKRGIEIPVIDTGAPIFDVDGSLTGIVITFQDETEKRKQQRLIKESEDRLRSSLNNMIEGCQIIGYDYKYLFINKAATVSSRKLEEDLLGKTMMECYPGIEKTEMFRKLKSCMENRTSSIFENEFIYPDGDKKIFNLRFEPVPEGMFILSEDITDYKMAQDFILKFKMGIELSGDAVFLTDTNGIITYVNPSFEKIFGYSKEEALGNTPRILKSGIFDKEYYEKFWQEIIAKKAISHEIVNKTKDNRLLYIEASINPIINEKNEVLGFIAIERDITERKLAEEKSKQLIDIIEAAPDFIATADVNGNSIYINNAGIKMLGITPVEDITKVTIAECHPDWARDLVLNEGLPSAVRDGSWHGETALKHRNGHEVPVSQIIIAHKSAKGETEFFSTISRNITERKRIEKELIEKTTILESFFDNTLTLIALLDREFNFIRVNKAYADADERDVDFFIGKNHFDLYPSDAKEIFEEVVRTKTSCQAIEKPFIYENNPERGITNWDWSLVPLLDAEGEVASLIFTLLNVTDRVKSKEKLVENEKFLTSLFNSVNDAIFTVSMPDRTIINVNKAVSDLFGCDPVEIIGKQTRILYPSDEAFIDYGRKLSAAIDNNKSFVRTELKLRKKDGTDIFCDVQTTFLKSSSRNEMVISVLRDITDKKKMIDELIAAKVRAEEMNRLKSSFLANMSHELRTPLIGISGFADFLMQDLEDSELKEMAENIFLSGNRLSETLNLILDLSKFESEKMEFHLEKVDLVIETNEILKLFSKAAEKQGLYLKSLFSHPTILIYTDGRAYRTILNNLINNAIKFTSEGGVIVDVSVIENGTEIKVKDTGIGIAEEYHNIIFEEFRQVSEGHSRNFEGTGLGLNITKKLVDKFGGSMFVESTPGKGSTFIVKLPLTAGDEISDKKPAVKLPEEKHISATPKVKPLALLVDDDPLVHPVLKRYLANQIELETASDGEFAIKLCKVKKYDLVFMDINLKRGLDGKQVTRELRKLKEYESVPIIAITAYAMVGDREEFLEAGCSHYLSKPFKQQDVLNLIGEIII